MEFYKAEAITVGSIWEARDGSGLKVIVEKVLRWPQAENHDWHYDIDYNRDGRIYSSDLWTFCKRYQPWINETKTSSSS